MARGIALVLCLLNGWCFVAPSLACGEARGGSIPHSGAVTDEQRSHRPNWAQPKGRQSFSLQVSLLTPYRSTSGYARRSRLAWSEKPLPQNTSHLGDTTLVARCRSATSLRACLKNRLLVAQATRRTERERRFEPMGTVFSRGCSRQFRSAGRPDSESGAGRPRHPFSKQTLKVRYGAPSTTLQRKTSDTPVTGRLFSVSHESNVKGAAVWLDRTNKAKQVRNILRGVKWATSEVTYGDDGESLFAPADRRRPAGRR